ncbi:MAG: HdeA/HdeB family [Pseudomonadota bacterium]|jgi:hypothetical protein
MLKPTHSLILTAVLTIPLLHATAGAAEGEEVDMNHYLCKDIMRMSGEERGVALGVMHGYALGKKGATSFKSDEASALSSEFIEYCLDNPTAKALESFEKLMK